MTEGGERVSGALEGESHSAVVRLLEEKRLFPVNVWGKDGAAAKDSRVKRKIKSRDLGTMYGQLADLIGSGVPLLRALDSLIKSTASASLKELLKEIRAAVSEGKSLTD